MNDFDIKEQKKVEKLIAKIDVCFNAFVYYGIELTEEEFKEMEYLRELLQTLDSSIVKDQIEFLIRLRSKNVN